MAQRILITGASSGIGAETARRLGERGADLALVARSTSGLQRTANAVREAGGTAFIRRADVTDEQAVRQAVDQAAERLGGLDGLIVNAGVGAYGRFQDTSTKDFDRTIEVTLIGAANTIRAALPHLERCAGTIVVTGSVASQIPLPLMAAYTAAKHGLRGFVNALRVELQASGSEVRIGLVHPGPVDTPFWNNVTPATVVPPDFPTAYTAERIADELIAALEKPRPESIVGGWMQIARAARGVVRPVFDFALAQATRYALAHPSDREPGNALWEASGTARLDGGIEDRPRWVGHAS